MLSIEKLVKIYEDGTVGVDGLNMTVKAGEVYVMLGANGAGKTSTIMMILGFTEPTAGRVLVNGVDVQKDPLTAKKHVAYVSENVTLYGNFTARQNLDFFTRLSGRTDIDENEYLQVVKRIGLDENAFKRRVGGFSKGMRQRLGIAIAILKRAGLIVMDEPTSGLDPKGGHEFMQLVKSLREEGKAILMSSHDIFRAKEIADRVGIMRSGKLIEEFDKTQLASVNLEKIYLDYMAEETAGATSAKIE